MFIPYNTERPDKRPAYATVALVATSIVVFAYQFLFTNPLRFIRHYGLLAARPTWYAPLTSQFVYGGFLHLAGNMLCLYLLGRDIEDGVGPYVFVALCFVGALGGSLMQLAAASHSRLASFGGQTVGASAVVSAVAGFYAVRFWKTRVIVWYWYPYGLWWLSKYRSGTARVKGAWFVGLWFIWQAAMALVAIGLKSPGGVGLWSHVGGTLTGVVSALLIGSAREARCEYAREAEMAAEGRGAESLALLTELIPTDGKMDEAEARAVEHLPLRRWEQILRTNPTDAETHLKVGQALAQEGDQAAANEHFALAFSLLLDQEKPDRAASAYGESLSSGIRPALASDLLFRLACASEETGHTVEAGEAWSMLADGYPAHPQAETAVIRLARLREQNLGDLAGAAEAYSRYLKAYPQGQWRDLAQTGLKRVGEVKH